jgi:hypothetical protein
VLDGEAMQGAVGHGHTVAAEELLHLDELEALTVGL